MGTNYYLHTKPDCEACGRPYEPLHIGKSSSGWCFAMHVLPEAGILSLDDWRREWSKPGVEIRDEYGAPIPPAAMEECVTIRSNWCKPLDSVGVTLGPNGLLRHRVGDHCRAHGEGTWDYVEGEFS